MNASLPSDTEIIDWIEFNTHRINEMRDEGRRDAIKIEGPDCYPSKHWVLTAEGLYGEPWTHAYGKTFRQMMTMALGKGLRPIDPQQEESDEDVMMRVMADYQRNYNALHRVYDALVRAEACDMGDVRTDIMEAKRLIVNVLPHLDKTKEQTP